MKLLIVSLLFLPSLTNFNNPDKSEAEVISAFNQIKSNPEIVKLTNNIEVNNKGGHIQGIQCYETNNAAYIFMTGSSDTYSYLSIARNNENPQVISVNQLMDKPFKHAGGFQIYKNFLAVGIEDNSAKDKSKVCIYDITDPENPELKPIHIIERNGKPMRSTAGCIAIAEYKNKTILAVGDWDTKHIDFYTGNLNENSNDFQLTGIIDTENQPKSGWSDDSWLAYQNINLFNIDGNLYLIGLGQNQKEENIADLFRLEEKTNGEFSLIKLSTRTFNCNHECTFKAAAGVEFNDGIFRILASEYNILDTTYLNLFTQ